MYKIASSCIAARLKTALPKLIGDDQKGFLKGRYTGGNIRLLYDTLLYAKQHQIPGLLLMVYFEKAFDSVAWSFIEKSLCKFKFGKDITQWILTFYTNINSCVHVNGQYSQWFDVKRYETGWSAVSLFISYLCRTVSLNDTSKWKHTWYKHPRWRDIVVTICRWYNLFPGWYKRITLLMYVCLTAVCFNVWSKH